MGTFLFTVLVGLVVVVVFMFISMIFEDFEGCMLFIILMFLLWLIGKVTLILLNFNLK